MCDCSNRYTYSVVNIINNNNNNNNIIIIIIIIIILASWDKPSRHEEKEMKITNCNRLAGSERALE